MNLQTRSYSHRVSHRNTWIIEGLYELQSLFRWRANIFSSSSTEHPLRRDVTAGTHLVMNPLEKNKTKQPISDNLAF